MPEKDQLGYTLRAKPSKGLIRRYVLTDSYWMNTMACLLKKPPLKVDLRETGFVSPIKDQGPFEVSIGIALVNGCLEFIARKDHDITHELSWLYPYRKERSNLFPDKRNTVTSFLDAVQVLKDNGCPPGRLDSYGSFIDYESFDWKIVSSAMRVRKCYRMKFAREVKHSLAQGYPVACLVDVYPSMFDVNVFRDGDISIPESSEKPVGIHAFTIVGFEEVKQCFIVKNSWSKSWGDYGFGYLPYKAFNLMLREAYSLRL